MIKKAESSSKAVRIFKKMLAVLLIAGLVAALSFGVANTIVVMSTDSVLYDLDEISGPEEDCDCIIVLGCGVYDDETPTPFLHDRLATAVSLYHQGYAPKILMSGDHGRDDYNEVGVMRKFALDNGVPSEDIFMDHAGFSTYETMIRAKEIFGISKAIVVTQSYHLARSVYDCRAFGIDCKGVRAIQGNYIVKPYNYVRESIARCKDLIWCIFKPAPTYRGPAIDIHGNGEVTLD
ncbi:protein SanA, affects membrane permeability for vancomycin [Ruminococcaceae bacterium YRB3002]|nr:protein SanA, affects membrane permeability for vancomycin [Ruminococcaceae bacterium YRB3002]